MITRLGGSIWTSGGKRLFLVVDVGGGMSSMGDGLAPEMALPVFVEWDT